MDREYDPNYVMNPYTGNYQLISIIRRIDREFFNELLDDGRIRLINGRYQSFEEYETDDFALETFDNLTDLYLGEPPFDFRVYETDECPVCFEEYSGNRCILKNCGHSVCKNCIKVMLVSDRNLKCPQCRTYFGH